MALQTSSSHTGLLTSGADVRVWGLESFCYLQTLRGQGASEAWVWVGDRGCSERSRPACAEILQKTQAR